MSAGQRLILVAAILGSGIAAIDSTVVNVALPAIERDLGGGLSLQQWVANGYLLTLGSLILLGGSLGDRFGERRVFSLGVGAFGVCSVLCAIAPSGGVLLGARVLQGAAGALLVPSSLAAIVAGFPPGERGAAIGAWTAWGAISQVIGPLLGGVIVQSVSWRWIFAINVPLALVTIVLIRRALPAASLEPAGAAEAADPSPAAAAARGRPGAKLDVPGAALGVLGLAGVVFALIEEPHHGWGTLATLGPLLAGLGLLALFLLRERSTPEPMLDLSLFTRGNFAWGNLETAAMYAGLGGLIFFLQIYLQQVAGYRALDAGLTTLPITVLMFGLSRRFGALADRFGPRLFMGAGPLVAAGGMLLLLRCGLHAPYLSVLLPALVVFALGLSLTVAPLTATVLAAADEHNAGIASAINNAIARVGGLIAVSLLGLVAAGSLHHGSFHRNAAGVSAFHGVMLVCAGLVAAGGVAGLVGIRRPGA